jgi:hypothetical protein
VDLALQSSRISEKVKRAVTVALHEGLAKTAESGVISSGIPFGTQEQKFDGKRSAGRGWRDLRRFTMVNEA